MIQNVQKIDIPVCTTQWYIYLGCILPPSPAAPNISSLMIIVACILCRIDSWNKSRKWSTNKEILPERKKILLYKLGRYIHSNMYMYLNGFHYFFYSVSFTVIMFCCEGPCTFRKSILKNQFYHNIPVICKYSSILSQFSCHGNVWNFFSVW